MAGLGSLSVQGSASASYRPWYSIPVSVTASATITVTLKDVTLSLGALANAGLSEIPPAAHWAALPGLPRCCLPACYSRAAGHLCPAQPRPRRSPDWRSTAHSRRVPSPAPRSRRRVDWLPGLRLDPQLLFRPDECGVH